jgi:hypothetical protein
MFSIKILLECLKEMLLMKMDLDCYIYITNKYVYVWYFNLVMWFSFCLFIYRKLFRCIE